MKTPRVAAIAAAIVLAAAIGAAGVAHAQAYPNKPIRLVVPYPPGQGTDVLSRTVAAQLSQTLRQQVVIDNRAGAGGNIGAEFVAKSPADGYTLVMGTNATHAANATLYGSTPFDHVKDFSAVVLVGTLPMVLSASTSFPPSTIAQLAEAARARPGTINTALPSTTARVVFEMAKASGLDLFPVPYKGSGPAFTDLFGGQVQLTIDTVTASLPQIAAGKVKALAITTGARTELAPNIPTFVESGFQQIELVAWNALFAPAGTPREIVATLNAEVNAVLKQPEVRQRLLQIGFQPEGGPPERLAAFVTSETQKWSTLVKRAGIKAD